MNKTVTINIGGKVFYIEEDAFEKLNRYLQTIKGYFSASDGRDEIMADIEARIAELLQPKLNAAKQVVMMADLDEVIAIMGQPEQFAAETGSEPKKETKAEEPVYTQSRRRRVFRNPDDKVLGGVCSGIAAYFDIDPLWLRLAFGISFFVFGTGFLFYILLWIIIPEAKTAADRLEMRGENVNVNNIGKVINEEMGNVKRKVGQMADDAKKWGNESGKQKVSDATDKFIELIKFIFKGVAKVFAIILVIVCLTLLGFIIAGSFGAFPIFHFNGHGFTLHGMLETLFENTNLIMIGVTGFILLFGIPILALIYKGIKMIFGIKVQNKIIGWTASSLWLLGVVFVVYTIVVGHTQVSEDARHTQTIMLAQPKSNVLYLKVNANPKFDDYMDKFNDESLFQNKARRWVHSMMKESNATYFSTVSFDIVPSDNDSFKLVVIKKASGSSPKEAASYANNMEYSFSQNDSVLNLDSWFTTPPDEKWRFQRVKLRLMVPKNKTVYLDRTMGVIIYDIENVRNTLDKYMINRKWIMKPEGLDCIDCDGLDKKRTKVRRTRAHVDIDEDGIDVDVEDLPEPPEPPPAPEEL